MTNLLLGYFFEISPFYCGVWVLSTPEAEGVKVSAKLQDPEHYVPSCCIFFFFFKPCCESSLLESQSMSLISCPFTAAHMASLEQTVQTDSSTYRNTQIINMISEHSASRSAENKKLCAHPATSKLLPTTAASALDMLLLFT